MTERNRPESMHTSESVSELDELIQSSLASYGEPSPDSKLAQRILVRIASEPRPVVSHRWLPWAVAMPIAACLIAAFVLFELNPVHAPASRTDHARVTAPLGYSPPAGIAPGAPYRTQREKRNRLTRTSARPQLAAPVAKAQPLPKLDVFPTPRPLTPTEQTLVQFALRAPKSERESLVEAQQQPDTPLTIAAIKIQPIELPELGMN